MTVNDNGSGAVGVRDLRLDESGDLYVGNGDLALVSGDEAAVQGVRLRLGFFLGEWYLDRDVGIPYFQRILVKHPNFAEVREWLRLAIVDTPDISAVNSILLTYNSEVRSLRVDYQADTINGALERQTRVLP